MKTKRVFFVFALLLLISCQNNAVKDAISAQLRQYPDTRVQDIYKNFCQDNLGPGHLVPDPEVAKSYLLTELELYRDDLDSARYDKPASRYVPVGDKGNYVRVDLSVVLDGICDADREMDQKERLEKVLAAVKSLPDKQRHVLILRTIKGLSYEEIAEKTGINYLALRVLLSRARQTLRQVL